MDASTGKMTTGEAAAPAAPPLSEAEKNTIIGGVLLTMLLAALDQTIVAPAMPTIARSLGHAEYLPWIEAALSTEALRAYFAHVLRGGAQGSVARWRLPGSHSLNILLRHALGGGGAGGELGHGKSFKLY